jgi:uncharacterized protein
MKDLQKPIDGVELLELHRLFPKHDEASFSLVSLDGFFHGLLCLVKNVMPSEWLNDVMPEAAGRSQKSAEKAIGLLFRYFNTVVARMKDKRPEPYFDGSKEQAAIWLEGFGRGFSYDESSLLKLTDAEAETAGEENVPLSAIVIAFALDVTNDTEESQEKEEILGIQQKFLSAMDAYSAEENQEMLSSLVAAIKSLLEPARDDYLETEFGIQRTPKVGRNDPCPCGSSRKYKHCHGKT